MTQDLYLSFTLAIGCDMFLKMTIINFTLIYLVISRLWARLCPCVCVSNRKFVTASKWPLCGDGKHAVWISRVCYGEILVLRSSLETSYPNRKIISRHEKVDDLYGGRTYKWIKLWYSTTKWKRWIALSMPSKLSVVVEDSAHGAVLVWPLSSRLCAGIAQILLLLLTWPVPFAPRVPP